MRYFITSYNIIGFEKENYKTKTIYETSVFKTGGLKNDV